MAQGLEQGYGGHKKSNSGCVTCGRIILGLCFLSSVIALTLSWLLAVGIPSFSGEFYEEKPRHKQPRRLNSNADINSLKESFQFVAKHLKLSEESLVRILRKKIYNKNKASDGKKLSAPVFQPNYPSKSDAVPVLNENSNDDFKDEYVTNSTAFTPSLDNLVDTTTITQESTDSERYNKTSDGKKLSAPVFQSNYPSKSDAVPVLNENINDDFKDEYVTTSTAITTSLDNSVETTTITQESTDSERYNKISPTSRPSVIPDRDMSSEWDGTFYYPGYGLFSIGKYEEPFTVNITSTRNIIKAEGLDSQGRFIFEGEVWRWKKVYSPRLCTDIIYQAELVEQKKIEGTVSFTSCSTAKFVSDNPGLAAFAPSKSSGAGTFSMVCRKYCDSLNININKDNV